MTSDINEIHETFSYGVIYVYSIPDERHKGRLKIGSATLISSSTTQENIDAAAHVRIKQQTKTADIPYKLEHAELSITKDGEYFSDETVHKILIRSGYKRKSENTKNDHSEWFEVNLEVAKKSILAAKERRIALTSTEKDLRHVEEFSFRPNQLDAIDKTTKAIKQKRKRFLWNAKMRFGKTSAAMQVARENNMQKVLIVTHRPSVSVDWYTDFGKVFSGTNYEYSSKNEGERISTFIKNKQPFVYFASMQDLRLSKRVVDDESSKSKAQGFPKNDEVFDTTWDMLIVDEAHEGTQSDLGTATFNQIPTIFTLQLSGTPFNILHKHEENDIYTWDYVMEQEEKLVWDERNPGTPNPYAELPALSMFTYDIDKFSSSIGKLDDGFRDTLDGAFRFHEFFRVHKDDQGNDLPTFVHEEMVNRFLDLLVSDKLNTKFPYSTKEYQSYNKHSLWLLPNRVKVIEAMQKLLKDHDVFGSGQFGIVNISGTNTDDEDRDAKEKVVNAIKKHDYTITLTGQRLTTGASIPEWTAVFMMSDTSSATTYLQTAFRCQTPARIDGKIKTQGYVFDFAPDRTLKLIAEAIELNHKSGKVNSPDQKEAMAKFLNFCPILAAEGGTMKPYDVGTMLVQLKKAIIDRVSRNGFDDPKLYNDELLKLNELDLAKFNELKEIVGKSTSERINEIEVNNLGMTDLVAEKAEEAEHKKRQKKELSAEDREKLKLLKEARDQKASAISILRAVSIRMPMMVYGASVSIREDITLKKFIELVDEESWQEFMPAGLSKKMFKDFAKYYDEEVFRGVTRSIRAKAFDCDELLPTERIQAIAEIFKTFKNPDKETVLTPWDVVNMQLSMTLGGHDFRQMTGHSNKPQWVSQGSVSSIWTQDDAKVLEINSKSGLYPLLAAYNFYTRQLIKVKKPEDKVSNKIWQQVLAKNIFVLCKSPMAERITGRTLSGYNLGNKANIVYIKDLVKKLQQKGEYKDYNLDSELREKFGLENNMKFTAVIGNPPYQVSDSGAFASASPIYHLFVQNSKMLNPRYISLVIPARWYAGGKGLDEFRNEMLHDERISIIHDFPLASDVFPNIRIAGGICVFLWDKEHKDDCVVYEHSANQITSEMKRPLLEKGTDSFIRMNNAVSILRKILSKNEKSFATIVSSRKPYGLTTDFFKDPKKFNMPNFSENAIEGGLSIYGTLNYKTVKKYVTKNYPITVGIDTIDKYKVFVSQVLDNGFDSMKERLKPFLAKPGDICTETFLRIGAFDNKDYANNVIKYMNTKFFHILLFLRKISHHVTAKVYQYIPTQQFSGTSDINWFKSIGDIDKQLYAKYGLDEKEIEFIETHVKPME